MPLSISLPSFSTNGYDCRCSCPSLDTINPNSSDAIVKNAMSLSRLPSSISISISISIFSSIIVYLGHDVRKLPSTRHSLIMSFLTFDKAYDAHSY